MYRDRGADSTVIDRAFEPCGALFFAAMPTTARLFLALWPPRAVRDALADHMRQWQWSSQARPTPLERLHLTLHFIGAVPEARLDELKARLHAPFLPFTLELARPEVWPGGIAVLCATQTPAALQTLHAQLGERLRALGLPVDERPLRPHVTLARKAQGAHRPAQRDVIAWDVSSGYALVRSLGNGQGYQTLQVFG
jgi:2'-5' RNA ligase